MVACERCCFDASWCEWVDYHVALGMFLICGSYEYKLDVHKSKVIYKIKDFHFMVYVVNGCGRGGANGYFQSFALHGL